MPTHMLIFRKLIVFVLFFTVHLQAQDRLSGKSFATRSMAIAQHGMACTSHPLATIAAIDILKKGGTAIDAAIAANAVLGVTDPEMDGIGGDLFAIVFDAKTKKLYGLNASGRSPYLLTPDILKKRSLAFVPWEGPLSVTVPGCVDGWFELHKKFGKIAMPVILAAAINYARNGFPAGNEYANVAIDVLHGLEMVKAKADKDENPYYNNLMKLYYPDGKPAAEGEIIKNADLANSLEKIANTGRDAFYKGDIAKAIDSYMKKMGGFISYKDLADHTSNWIEPVSSIYRGYQVWELPPNGQGITVLQILNLLEPYDFSKISYGSPEHIHLFTEATKLAYEDRAKFYADPDFATISVGQIISKSYAKKRGALINIEKASADYSNQQSLYLNYYTYLPQHN